VGARSGALTFGEDTPDHPGPLTTAETSRLRVAHLAANTGGLGGLNFDNVESSSEVDQFESVEWPTTDRTDRRAFLSYDS